MTADEAKQIIAVVESSWPGKPFTEVAVRMWGAKLMDHPAAAVMRIVSTLLETSKWRPSLAEILEPLRADPGHKSASEAFETVWGQIGKRPRAVNEIEERAVRRLGGWDRLGQWQLDDRHWHAKRFAEVYDEIVDGERSTDLRAIASPDRLALKGGTR